MISNLTTQARCNGTYQKRAEEVNGVAAYQQLEDPDKWLCFNSNNRWTVQAAAQKGRMMLEPALESGSTFELEGI